MDSILKIKNTQLGHLLRYLRKERMISVELMAAKLGISTRQVQNLESGSAMISAVQLQIYCKCCRLSGSTVDSIMETGEIWYSGLNGKDLVKEFCSRMVEKMTLMMQEFEQDEKILIEKMQLKGEM